MEFQSFKQGLGPREKDERPVLVGLLKNFGAITYDECDFFSETESEAEKGEEKKEKQDEKSAPASQSEGEEGKTEEKDVETAKEVQVEENKNDDVPVSESEKVVDEVVSKVLDDDEDEDQEPASPEWGPSLRPLGGVVSTEEKGEQKVETAAAAM